MKRKQSWVLRTPEVFENCMDAILKANATDDLWKITLERYVPPKTSAQNNTLHMWIGELADATGHTLDECKGMVKDAFYPRHEKVIAGRLHIAPKSTTELTIAECSEVMERMLAEWSEYVDFTIPDPTKAQ